MAALLGLIECPVVHAMIAAPRQRTIAPADFEFISQNAQIETILTFLRSLPQF